MATSSVDSNGPSMKSSRKWQHTLSSSSKKLKATLIDVDVMDCPVCYHVLTIPIFQCENGHVICSSCNQRLRKKCATCFKPTCYRSRAMERVLEALKVPCPNEKFGCSDEISYDEMSTHLNQCAFTQILCPFSGCHFIGSYKDIYKHCVPRHCKSSSTFKWGEPLYVQPLDGERVILKEQTTKGRGELVIVECFNKGDGGRIFIARCIGPGTEEFSYEFTLFASSRNHQSFGSSLRRVDEVSSEAPKKHFMRVDSYMCPNYRLFICINRETYLD